MFLNENELLESGYGADVSIDGGAIDFTPLYEEIIEVELMRAEVDKTAALCEFKCFVQNEGSNDLLNEEGMLDGVIEWFRKMGRHIMTAINYIKDFFAGIFDKISKMFSDEEVDSVDDTETVEVDEATAEEIKSTQSDEVVEKATEEANVVVEKVVKDVEEATTVEEVKEAKAEAKAAVEETVAVIKEDTAKDEKVVKKSHGKTDTVSGKEVKAKKSILASGMSRAKKAAAKISSAFGAALQSALKKGTAAAKRGDKDEAALMKQKVEALNAVQTEVMQVQKEAAKSSARKSAKVIKTTKKFKNSKGSRKRANKHAPASKSERLKSFKER